LRKLLLFIPLSYGCIIVDDNNEKYYDDWESWDTGDKPDVEESPEAEEEEMEDPEDEEIPQEDETPLEDHNGSFTLTPFAGPPGSTFITALRSAHEIDWYSIEAITAYGDIEICHLQPLYDEALLTITIPEDAQEAPIDFLVQYTDGDVDLIEDAFYIDNEADLSSAVVSPEACE